MWSSVVGALLGKVAPKVADYYIAKQEKKFELKLKKIDVAIAREEAKQKRISESEARDDGWERAQIANSGWKDEYVLIILSIPLVLSFIPWTVAYVQMGFAALAQTPEWYRWLILLIFTAIYGIRVWRRKIT